MPQRNNTMNPARYTGGEWNAVKKTGPVRARFCLCFPDLYEIGMSNLGLQILYGEINARQEFAAERCYAPAEDMAALLRKNGIPLLSLETAMITQFGDESDTVFRHVMIASTGGSICLIVLIMAAFMILLATKSLKKLQNNSSEA